jgi:lipopolysaccharide cholinephosphotransferase
MDIEELFPDEREKGENRLRQCQLVMLRLLKIFDYLCTKHDIKYFLTGGTLLGAIRHQGFIPWDDDLDVGITRDNYEKFVQYAVPELPKDIFFQTPETDIYFASCGRVEARLKDKYSSYTLTDVELKFKKSHLGLQLDIFVYDRAYLPHNTLLYATNRLLQIMFWKIGVNNKGNLKRARVLKWISRYSFFPLVYASSFICTKKMAKKIGQSYKTEKEIAKVIRTKFEDMEAYIPIGWDSYLKRMYKNYMELPPIDKRDGHYSGGLPDPFTPCEHTEILHWKDRLAESDEYIQKKDCVRGYVS